MKTCDTCIYKNRRWGENPCRTCFGVTSDYENWTGADHAHLSLADFQGFKIYDELEKCESTKDRNYE